MEYLILNFLKAQAVNRVNSELIVTMNSGVYWVYSAVGIFWFIFSWCILGAGK